MTHVPLPQHMASTRISSPLHSPQRKRAVARAAHHAPNSTNPEESTVSHAHYSQPPIPLATPASTESTTGSSSPSLPCCSAAHSPDADWWLAYAAAMDTQASKLALTHSRIARAAALEDYTTAATCSSRKASLEAANSLHAVHEQLSAAVASQDFTHAAALRDSAMLGLKGWWRVCAEGQDSWGHLVRISEDYGRLQGRAYSPGHLADVHGWKKDSPYHSAAGNMTMEEAGVPLFEIMLHRRKADGAMCSHTFLLPDKISHSDRLGKSILQIPDLQPSESPPTPSAGSQPLRPPSSPPHPPSLDASRALLERLAAATDSNAITSKDSAPPSSTPHVEAPSSSQRHSPIQPNCPERKGRHDDASPAASSADGRQPAGGSGGPKEGGPPRYGALAPASTDPPSGSFAGGAEEQLSPRSPLERGASVRTLSQAVSELQHLEAQSQLEQLLQQSSVEDHAPSQCLTPPSRISTTLTPVDRCTFTLDVPPLSPEQRHTKLTYSRLDDSVMDEDPADPFTGYFLGSFGVHGPELLHLQLGIWEGEEAVVAYKVTGDPHVPAGQVSFRAKIGSRHRLPTDSYPSQMDVAARFAGQGCVAENGFSNPQWCKGDLLTFGPQRSQQFQRLTGNAELGFIWNMVHSKRFLILLSRVNFGSG